jgi:hypothetical protein
MPSRSLSLLLALAVVSGAAPRAARAAEATLPARPEEIVFAPLAFEPPDAATFRRTLPDGTVVYLAPSRELPLVTIAITFKGGASLDPADAPGLAAMTARMVREGGTAKNAPAEFDETLDFLATEVSVAANETFTTATMNCLKSNLDESLRLFVEMLRSPAFDQQRLETTKARQIEALKQRNDDAASILGREWKRLVYGIGHFESAEPTGKTVAAIDREKLAALHGKIFHPGNAPIRRRRRRCSSLGCTTCPRRSPRARWCSAAARSCATIPTRSRCCSSTRSSAPVGSRAGSCSRFAATRASPTPSAPP